MNVYSFLSVNASMAGPGGSFAFGNGNGNSEEGITIEPNQDIATLTIGADGTPMHSLHADRSGKLTIRLLKTSPLNQKMMALYNAQTLAPALYGQNVVSINDIDRGDAIVGASAGFARAPTLVFAKEGGMNEWTFNVGIFTRVLGGG